MTLARWQATIVDAAGNLLPAAQITVRREIAGAPLASIYADRDGTLPLGNPFPADSEGFAGFHAPGGAYRITATSGAFSRSWRYVGIGLAGEGDTAPVGVAYIFDSTTADADPGAGFFRLNHATPANATAIFIDNTDANGVAQAGWLDSLDDGSNSADRGTLILRSADSAALLVARVTGSVVDGTGYRKLTIAVLAASDAASFIAGTAFGVIFSRSGADGTGDVTGPAGGVVEAEYAQFDGTTGKVIQGSGKLNADVAAIHAATANRIVSADLIESASAYEELTDAATIAIDWDTGINFAVEIAGNRVLGNPTNGQVGTWRTVYVFGNDGTARTLTFGNQYTGEIPVLTTISDGTHYLLTIFCAGTTQFVVSAKLAFDD